MLIIKGMIMRSVVEQSRSLLAVTRNCAVEYHGRYILRYKGTHSHIASDILKL